MSPEEHLRRLKNDEVWRTAEHVAAPVVSPVLVPVRDRQRDRGPMWVTAAVAAALVVVTLAAVHGADRQVRWTGAGAPAASMSKSATPTPTPTADPLPAATASRSAAASDPSLRQVRFYPHDPADMARARTIITCFKRHGVKIVELVASEDDPGIKAIAYGGPHNDQGSIVTGLKYQDECFEAGGPAK